jgi:DNA-binding FadR family transcriptional regulator
MGKIDFPQIIKPLNRESISVSIFTMIIDSLLSQHLKPGDKLPTEAEFAEKLGVGRNSVREAIKMLYSFGVIDIRRGQGTFIAKSTSSSTILNPLLLALFAIQGSQKELTELRIMIDVGIIELVIRKANKDDIQELEAANNKLKEAAKNKATDFDKLCELDFNFHKKLLKAIRNPLITKLAEAVYTLFLTSIEETVKKDVCSAAKNHERIIKTIKKKDFDLARKILIDTLSQEKSE